MHVNGRLERKILQDGGIDIDEIPAGVLGINVAATGFAPFAGTLRCFVVGADVFRAARNLQRCGFP